MVIPKLDDASLAALASQGHGMYRRLSADDSDFTALLAPFKYDAGQAVEVKGQLSDQWRDEGPWLLLPLMLLAALAFRRGYLVVLVLVLLPQAHPAYAFGWDDLWQRADQRGQQAMDANQPKQAAQLFHDPQWRAAANYKAGNYAAALDSLKGIDTAQADYNRGNALAQLGKLPEAVQAYDAALKHDPKLPDAQFNRNLVAALIKQQQQQQQQKQAQKNQQQPSPRNPQQPGKNDASKPDSGQSTPPSGADKPADKSPKPSQDNPSAQNQTQAGAQPPQQAAGKTATQPQASQPQAESKAGKNQAAATQTDQLKPADKQQLQRIPDDPGGLWRRKFQYQYQREQAAPQNEAQPW
jgi:Ca-activated chloride channel family protein